MLRPTPLGNTAIPLDVTALGLMLAALVLGVALLVVAWRLSRRPPAVEGEPTGRGQAVFAIVGGLALSALGAWVTASEWRPQSAHELWTGVWFWLPIALGLVAVGLGAARLSAAGSAERWRRGRKLAWGLPLGLWAGAWAVLLAWASLGAHCS